MDSYKDRGFSDTLERIQQDDKKIPYMSEFDIDSYIQGISASLIRGGIIKSNDGKLTIDLENGHITYSDGITVVAII